MLTDEMINELEQVTKEYIAIVRYNEAAFDLEWAAAAIGERGMGVEDLHTKFVRAGELKTKMLTLQHKCLKETGGAFRIPNGIHRSNINKLTFEDGIIIFEKPMDAVEFYRLVKAETHAD